MLNAAIRELWPTEDERGLRVRRAGGMLETARRPLTPLEGPATDAQAREREASA